MKYLILISFIILFTGCSAKCIQNEYDCNAFEKGVKGTLDVAGDIANIYNAANLHKLY